MENKYFAMMKKISGDGGVLDALLAAQAQDGYVTEEAISAAAQVFGKTSAAVYDTASFYGMLDLIPRCTHQVRLCRGGSCHVDGADAIRVALEQYFGVEMGQATPSRSCDIGYIGCQGQCGEGPVVTIDDEMYFKQTADSVIELLKKGGIH